MNTTLKSLIAKYDVPVPRYTSYPTVPYWENNITTTHWLESVRTTLEKKNASWSLYMHIPFCESLCTFCGCNTVITKDHSKEISYIKSLLTEWAFYLNEVQALSEAPLRNLHLGGGTPSFLSAENLVQLLTPILNSVKKDSEHFEASIEVDPRRTNNEQLENLYKLGFSRISMGVQDFNSEVQRLINRIQSFESTYELIRAARLIGYKSINLDLIYGLAGQTPESFKTTLDQTIKLKPDRIALYSFALVPWIKPQHRLFKDEDIPTGEKKRELYELARHTLLENEYVEVGMDHFALKTDTLAHALENKKLHRNFMGYTDVRTDLLLGIGVSSISESHNQFHQNEKLLPVYSDLLNKNTLPTHRGHHLSTEDLNRREKILKLITNFSVTLEESELQDAYIFFDEFIKDNLIQIKDSELKVTAQGKAFIRNICVFFDARMRQKNPQQRVFSGSI